jgi:hypothetical protein
VKSEAGTVLDAVKIVFSWIYKGGVWLIRATWKFLEWLEKVFFGTKPVKRKKREKK